MYELVIAERVAIQERASTRIVLKIIQILTCDDFILEIVTNTATQLAKMNFGSPDAPSASRGLARRSGHPGNNFGSPAWPTKPA